jgi:hypothetical protein
MSIVQTSPTQTLDFKQVIERANRTIRMTRVMLGFLTWFAITATIWLSLFALDNLLDLPTALRFPFGITGLIVTIVAFVKCVVGALRTHRSNEQVALMLEKQFGIEENVLINTMQFEEMDYSDKQKDFIRATASAATTGWSHVPLRELWQPGRMAKWCSAFAVLMAIWIAYSAIAPDYLQNAFTRYAFAFQDSPPAAAASLIMSPAENLTIAEFDDLDISLDVTKFADGKQLMIYPAIVYREGQGSVASDGTVGAEVKMRPVIGNPNLYQYTFEAVRRSFSFRIFVGGTYTRSVQVTVNAATKIVEAGFTITPPAYVAQPPREQSGPPYPVKCLPASRLDLTVKLDKPVESLVWQWPAGSVPLQDTGNQVWKGTIEVGDTGGNYDLVAVVRNLPNPIILSSGSVQLKTDRKPEVNYLDMELSHVVSPGATLPLRFEGKDDYGMQDMKLTLRRAKVGSQPDAIRDWTFGSAPGELDRIQKRVDLKIDASVFEPGNKYFLEVHGNDFCPTTDSGVSDALLVTVKDLNTNLADGDSDLKDLYAALERAIVLQKQALEGTQNLSVNINEVWLDVNRVKREDKDIQAALDAYREKILELQVNVRETLIKGVQLAPDQSIHMAVRMQSIAKMEAVEANHRAFAAGRVRLHAGKLKRANGFGPGTSFNNTRTQSVRFKSQPARYFGLVIDSAHGWSPRTYLEQLALVGEDTKEKKSPYLDSSKWKLVDSNVKDARNALAVSKGTQAPRVLLEKLPATFVFDMGEEQAVTGIACRGGSEKSPRDIAVYLTTDQAPEIVPVALDQERIHGEFKHLKTVQEMIYNQLLALKGGEFERLEKDKNLELAKLLGEDRNEAAPAADLAQAETNEKLKEWTEMEEELDALRNVITSKPTENLDEDDEKDLSDLDLKKLALKRDLEEMAEDLARSEWDFADKSEIDLYEATLHNIQDKLDDKIADLLALDSDKPKPDMSHNLDTVPQDSSQEIETGQQAPISGALVEPGQNEDAEDQGKLPNLGELPAELPANISGLVSGLDDLGAPVPESGSELMDHNSPSGSPASDNLDSASAAGQMAAQTPNPLAKTKGRGNIGRAGQSEGQMAASKAPAIPDNEVAMPARLVAGAGEDGQIVDEDNAPASAVGLGKGTGTATGFADVGKLPPDELNKLKEMLGAADHKSKENIRGLLLALNRHNLPTTDLKRALERLRQIQSNKQGVDVRQTLNEAIKHMRRAETSLASAYELRAQQIADGTFKDAHQSDTTGGTVPAGYENMVSNYFKAVAEESARKK